MESLTKFFLKATEVRVFEGYDAYKARIGAFNLKSTGVDVSLPLSDKGKPLSYGGWIAAKFTPFSRWYK